VNRAARCLLCVALIGCEKPRSPVAFAFDRDAGVLLRKSGRTCLAIGDTALAAQRVQFVAAATPQTAGTARVDSLADACRPLLGDDAGRAYYDATVLTGALEEGLPALALARITKPLALGDSGLAMDLDGDGRTDAFHSCTSAEGVHLTMWDGAPPAGRREWHRYVYLGYDLDPTCTEPETKPEAP
jgi:hypothetical protein